MDIAVSRNGKRVLNVWFAILVIFLYAPLGLLLLFSFNDNNLPVFPLRASPPRPTRTSPPTRSSAPPSSRARRWPRSRACSPCCSACWQRSCSCADGWSEVGRLRASPQPARGPLHRARHRPARLLQRGEHAARHPEPRHGPRRARDPVHTILVVPRLERLDIRLEEAARDLGAGWFQTFRLITLPLLLPALSPPTSLRSCFLRRDRRRLVRQRRHDDVPALPSLAAPLPDAAPAGDRVHRHGSPCSSSSEPRSAAGSSSGASVPSSSRERGPGEHRAPVHGPGEDDVAAGLDTRLRLVVHAVADDGTELRVDVELRERAEVDHLGDDALEPRALLRRRTARGVDADPLGRTASLSSSPGLNPFSASTTRRSVAETWRRAAFRRRRRRGTRARSASR